jgi:hypothetical protein
MKRFCCVLLLSVAWGSARLFAQASDQVDGVTVMDGKPYAVQAEQLVALTENIHLPFEVEVSTNGTFTVAKGKDRKLLEGQVLRSDGWLVKPDGSIEPVMDHLAMVEGKPTLVRDGQAEVLTKTMIFPNQLTVDPDGACVYPSGQRSRLADGQMFRMDGSVIPNLDAASLIKGRVVVQRGGTLIPLQPIQIMGMNDGTRVYGTGLIQKLDGTTFQLYEGETILIEGAIIRRDH